MTDSVFQTNEYLYKKTESGSIVRVLDTDHQSEAYPHTNIDILGFDTAPSEGPLEQGELRYNATDFCLEFGEPNGGALQIGQEERMFAKNRDASTILEGHAAYISGAAGDNVEMKSADADVYNEACCTIAVATEDILANANGRYTTFGFVRGLNTDAWSEGDVLWLSSTAGVLTNVKPSYPVNAVRVGVVTRKNANNGEIFVAIDHELRKFGDVTNGNFTGFEDDGTMVANGNAATYDDILNQLIGSKIESPSSDITQNNAEGTLRFKTSCRLIDYVVMNVQLSHKWKMGSSVFPHLHWEQNQNAVPNWLLQYRWQREGQPKTTAWTSAKMNSNVFTYTTGTLNQISGFPEIVPPTGYGISDIVQCRIIRDWANESTLFAGNDPYTGSAEAVNFDIHYLADTLGSRLEYSK